MAQLDAITRQEGGTGPPAKDPTPQPHRWSATRRAAVVLALLAVAAVLVVATLASRPAVPAAVGGVPFAEETIDPRDLGADVKAVADFDGDGLPDVAVGDDSGTGLQWYSAPDWTRHVIDDRSVFTTDMRAGDVDGDGDADLVVPDFADGRILWYANPGDGTGSWRSHVVGTGYAHDLRLGDVDADGRLDVVTRAHAGPTAVFLQQRPGEWVQVPVATASDGEGLALGDLDGDGDLDLVQNGYWLETPGDPAGEPWRRHDVARGWPDLVSAEVADMNRDGRLDIALAASESEGRLVWYEAPADPRSGAWRAHPVDEAVAYVHAFVIVDADLDGDPDIAFAEMQQSATRRVGLYLNGGDGREWTVQVLAASGSHNIRVADFDADGDPDIVGANYDGDSPLLLWRNLRTEPLANWRRHEVDGARPETAVFVRPADIDGDGREDLVSGAWWYRNPGDLDQPWERREIGVPLGQMAEVHDYDGDGDPDVLGTRGRGSEADADFVWARNDGDGTFAVLDNIEPAEGDFLGGAVTARFDPGGPLETALSWHEGPGIQMLTTPEDPSRETWTWRIISPTTQTNGLSAGDIDGDGDADLLLGTKWLRNDGEAEWPTFTLTEPDPRGEPDRPVLADVDGDGKLDAVVGYEVISAPGTLAWYEQPDDPTESWAEHMIATPIGPMSVGVDDMDGDGDLDVAVGEHHTDRPDAAEMIVFENLDGAGAEWEWHTVSVGDEHHDGAVLVDVDGDGDDDIASIGWTHGRVLLYENTAVTP